MLFTGLFLFRLALVVVSVGRFCWFVSVLVVIEEQKYKQDLVGYIQILMTQSHDTVWHLLVVVTVSITCYLRDITPSGNH